MITAVVVSLLSSGRTVLIRPAYPNLRGVVENSMKTGPDVVREPNAIQKVVGLITLIILALFGVDALVFVVHHLAK